MLRVKTEIHRCLIFFILSATAFISKADVSLPVTEIAGKNYYYYEVKKGDSLYGITKQHNWDPDIVIRLNPQASTELRKGQRIYYPVIESNRKETKSEVATSAATLDPIEHIVKKGETVYSIASLYGFSIDEIYASHPSARQGIKAGEKIILRQTPEKIGKTDIASNSGKPVYYTVKAGDTLYGVARSYHTTVEGILTTNRGLSEKNFRAGSVIRIIPDTDSDKIRTEEVGIRNIAEFSPHKVKKDETWNGIARRNGISVDELKEANEGISELKKNEVITIPVFRTDTVTCEYIEEDPREKTEIGRQELYNEIHDVAPASKSSRTDIVLLLANPLSNRDLDFTRGFLLALNNMTSTRDSINVRIVDAQKVDLDSRSIPALDNTELIITTYDKNFPQRLVEYASKSNVEIVNVFDVRSELFSKFPNFIQILPPTTYFNNAVTEGILSHFDPGTEFVFVGNEADVKSDALLAELREALKERDIASRRVSSLSGTNPVALKDGRKYVFCSTASKRTEVEQFINTIKEIKAESPMSEIAVIGRPNWVIYADGLNSEFGEVDTYIPSRFFFDTDNPQSKIFSDKYNEIYSHDPVKSFPMYAATGYDIALSFIPALIANKGDFNMSVPGSETLQTAIDIERVSNWGGFLNHCAYLIHFTPYHVTEKIRLK